MAMEGGPIPTCWVFARTQVATTSITLVEVKTITINVWRTIAVLLPRQKLRRQLRQPPPRQNLQPQQPRPPPLQLRPPQPPPRQLRKLLPVTFNVATLPLHRLLHRKLLPAMFFVATPRMNLAMGAMPMTT